MSSDSNLFERLGFGIVKTLEKRQGICDIKLAEKIPCDRPSIIQWEQKYSCMMTDDLRNFYMTSNGFSLQWSVKINENRIPVGRMEINSLEKLVRIAGSSATQDSKTPSLLDVELDIENDHDIGDCPSQPTFDHHSRIFELDGCEGFGKICYVYRETKPGIPASKADIWFLDRAFRWHFLANTFSNYYRMMIMHLGLPQWQYSFTDIGLSTQAKQWYNIYSPVRLGGREENIVEEPTDNPVTQLDIGRVFKGKLDKKKLTQGQQNLKKKPAVSSAKGLNRTPGSSLLQNRPIR